jgi:Glycosyltransferase family 87
MSVSVDRKIFVYCCVGMIFAFPIIGGFYWPADALYDVARHPLGRDFVNVWSAPRIVTHYGVMALANVDEYYGYVVELFKSGIQRFVWSYPPDMLLLAKPFSMLPYWPALIVWTLSGFAVYAAVALSGLAPGDRSVGLLFLMLAPATMINVVGGQNGFFTAALLLGTLTLLDRRPLTAGLLLGLLTIKPQLGLLIPLSLIAVGAWRTIAVAALTGALLILASVALWGTEPWIIWLTDTSKYLYRDLEEFVGFHALMIPSVFASVRVMGFSAESANVVQMLATLAVVAITPFAFRRTRDVSLRALLLTSGTLLASPYSYSYDMPAITAAILWVMMSPFPTTRVTTWIFGAAWILPAALYYLHYFHIGPSGLIFGCIYGIAVARIFRYPRATDSLPAAGIASPHLV